MASSFDVFENFHVKYESTKMSILTSAYEKLIDDRFLKAYSIEWANCRSGVSFTSAFVEVETYMEDLYSFGDLFVTGLEIFHDFIQSKKIPEVPQYQQILGSLLTYLLDEDNIMEELGFVGEHSKSEQDVTLLVLNHLLLRVTPDTKCQIDQEAQWKLPFCPDSCKHKPLDLEGGDTSIGHPTVWHGRIDALIGKPQSCTCAAVALTVNKDGSDSSEYRSCGLKKQFADPDDPNLQIISQCIVFSFLQKKLNPENKNTLTPTIGISATELVIYFYDCKHDILLQSVPSYCFKEAGVERIQTVLVAWLIVNYEYLCDGFVDILTTAPKAKFFEACEDKIDVYKHQIIKGGVGKGETKKVPWAKLWKANKKRSERLIGIKKIKLDASI